MSASMSKKKACSYLGCIKIYVEKVFFEIIFLNLLATLSFLQKMKDLFSNPK